MKAKGFIDRLKRTHPAAYKRRIGRLFMGVFRFVFIFGVAYVILYPIIIKLSIAFMSYEDMFDMTVKWIPRNPTLENFRQILRFVNYGESLLNSVIYSVGGALLQTASCCLSAYGLARFRFKGRGAVTALVVLMLIIPPQMYMLTTYSQFRFFDFFGVMGLFGMESVNLMNTPWPLFILSAGCCGLRNGLFVLVLKNFFERLPMELEEAAWVDGAGVFKIFWRVMLPNAKPALTTILVFSFVWIWNDSYFTRLLTPTVPILPNSLFRLISANTLVMFSHAGLDIVDFVHASLLTNTGALIIIAPMVLFFLIAQRFFVEGAERTGLTGM